MARIQTSAVWLVLLTACTIDNPAFQRGQGSSGRDFGETGDSASPGLTGSTGSTSESMMTVGDGESNATKASDLPEATTAKVGDASSSVGSIGDLTAGDLTGGSTDETGDTAETGDTEDGSDDDDDDVDDDDDDDLASRLRCGDPIIEGFDTEPTDPLMMTRWGPRAEQIVVTNGRLEFRMGDQPLGQDSGVTLGPASDRSEQQIVFETAPLPQHPGLWTFLRLGSDGCRPQFAIHDGTLRVGTPDDQATVAYDPDRHRFFRIVTTSDTFRWGVSADGEAWTELHDSEASCDLTQARVLAFVQISQATPEPIVVALETLAQCSV